jgi:hypothetical protein
VSAVTVHLRLRGAHPFAAHVPYGRHVLFAQAEVSRRAPHGHRPAVEMARSKAAVARPDADIPSGPPASVVLPAPRPAVAAPAPEPEAADVDRELVLEDLTQEQVLDWRTRAAADHQVVHDHIKRHGKHSAQRLFTGTFVDQVQRLSGLGHLDLGYTPWGQA